MINIVINGFGRIGKTFLRVLLRDKKTQNKIKIAVINVGPAHPEHVTLQFKYDSIMGTFPGNVSMQNQKLIVNEHEIDVIAECNPSKIDWKKWKIDWVVESSGTCRERKKASLHLKSGCKKVLITAPAIREDITIIPGVNDSAYNPQKHHITSLGSCTTNCFAPIVKILIDNLNLKYGLMTTIHAYTNDQVLIDIDHKDPRRGRAAAQNIIPTKTGAEKVITKIFPQLEGKLQATAIRVPVSKVSLVDFTFETKENLSKESINQLFKKAADSNLKNIVEYCSQPLVSCDFSGNPASCIIDSLITKATGNLGKVFGWYDNEWGYCERLKDFLLHNS